MKIINKILFIFIIFLILNKEFYSQNSLLNIGDANNNFYTIRDAAQKYFDTTDISIKGCGWKPFKRWEWFWEPRVYPSGEFPNSYLVYNEIKKIKATSKKDKQLANLWSFVGPQDIGWSSQGLGRVNCVRTHPQNNNIIWACAASGGLWKTTDGGSSWTSNTDELAAIGMTDLVFHPTNNNIMYLATGDGDHSDTYSIGVLKSTDGGNTWNPTGLIWNTSSLYTISRLLINPNNPDILIAAGSFGIYRTTNGGENWTRTFTTGLKDMEFKPGDPNIIYSCGTRIYRSTDGGASWQELTSGLPTTGISRIALAVTPANSNYIYGLYANSSSNGFMGLYRSTNGGNSWSMMSNSPNILGWSTSSPNGQAWYDLCLAVSPSNVNEIYSGGVYVFRSTDGGANWQSYSSNMHVDHHDLWFIPGTEVLYSGNDGGVYKKTVGQNQWTNLSAGLKITQFYRLGCSASNSFIIAGSQDNGTFLKNNTSNLPVYSGDGMEAKIDYSNANIMYACSQNGGLGRSTNGGSSFSSIKPSGATGAWITPYEIHPTNPQILFAGYVEVHKTTNRGTSWTTISSFGGSSPLSILEVCKSNPDYIYVARSTGFFRRTTNGGTSWSSVSYPYSGSMKSLEIHPENPNIIWVTFSGYSSSNKVFYSTNAGTNWTNITGNLPNVPANCIIYEENSPNRVYLGTDIGVWYKDDNNTNWIDFNNGLPNVVIDELEIQYTLKKIRAATFGRGIWESDLASIVVNPSITGKDTVCAFSRQVYKANQQPNASNRWYITNGTIVGMNNIDSVVVDWGWTDTGLVKLVQTDETLGISDSISKTITIIPIPNPNIEGNFSICAKRNTVYNTSSITGILNKWYVTNGTIIGSDTSSTITVQWDTLENGIIKLVQTNIIAECKDSVYQSVTINPLPKPIISGNEQVCLNTLSEFHTNPNNVIANKWYVENGIFIGSSEIDVVVIEWEKSGLNRLKLVQRNIITNCSDSIEITVNVKPTPKAEIIGNFDVCGNSLEIYKPSDTNDIVSIWEITNGTIIEYINKNEIMVLWDKNTTGSIKLKQYYANSDCIDTSLRSINILQLPNVEIQGENLVCEKTVYDYKAFLEQNIEILWEVVGGKILNENNKTSARVVWDTSGLGRIKLIKLNRINGCKDSSEIVIQIFPNPKANISGKNNSCHKCRQSFFGSNLLNNKWEIEGGVILNSDTSANVLVFWTDVSVGRIKLINTNKQTGCKDSVMMIVELYKYNLSEITGEIKTCQFKELPYTIGQESELLYEWSVNNGIITRIENNGSRVYVLWDKSGKNKLKYIQKLPDNSYIDSVELEVEVYPQPEKPTITRNDNTLISSASQGNIWYLDGVLTNFKTQNINPKQNGKYAVQYYDGNNCLSALSDEFNFIFTDIYSNEYYKDVMIYPNPTDNILNIKIPNDRTISYIKMTNILGEEIIINNISYNQNLYSINIDHLPEGIYIIYLTISEKNYSFRIIIKH